MKNNGVYQALSNYLLSVHGKVSSDDIFYHLLTLQYDESQIAGAIGYARRMGVLDIVGKVWSNRIKKMVNVYA